MSLFLLPFFCHSCIHTLFLLLSFHKQLSKNFPSLSEDSSDSSDDEDKSSAKSSNSSLRSPKKKKKVKSRSPSPDSQGSCACRVLWHLKKRFLLILVVRRTSSHVIQSLSKYFIENVILEIIDNPFSIFSRSLVLIITLLMFLSFAVHMRCIFSFFAQYRSCYLRTFLKHISLRFCFQVITALRGPYIFE